MKGVSDALIDLLNNEFKKDSMSRHSFVIIRITELARKMTRNIHKNQVEIVQKIQSWYDSLPEVSEEVVQKKFTMGKKNYMLTPSHGMRDVYAYFDPKRKSGCLLCIKRIK